MYELLADAAAGSFRNAQTPGAVRAWAGYLKTLARYEAERAQALADKMTVVYELA